MTVKITDLLEGLFLQKDLNKTFINVKSGEIISILIEEYENCLHTDIEKIENREEKRRIILAKRVRESDNFLCFPAISEDIRKNNLNSFITELTGKEADRSLSVNELTKIIENLGKLEVWYSYSLAKTKELILNWAFEHKIKVVNS